jgi:hypothetical protein
MKRSTVLVMGLFLLYVGFRVFVKFLDDSTCLSGMTVTKISKNCKTRRVAYLLSPRPHGQADGWYAKGIFMYPAAAVKSSWKSRFTPETSKRLP